MNEHPETGNGFCVQHKPGEHLALEFRAELVPIHSYQLPFPFLYLQSILQRGREKKVQKQKADTLLELLVFGAPSFSQESLSQLLQIPGVIHLNLCLLAEEILQVLQ